MSYGLARAALLLGNLYNCADQGTTQPLGNIGSMYNRVVEVTYVNVNVSESVSVSSLSHAANAGIFNFTDAAFSCEMFTLVHHLDLLIVLINHRAYREIQALLTYPIVILSPRSIVTCGPIMRSTRLRKSSYMRIRSCSRAFVKLQAYTIDVRKTLNPKWPTHTKMEDSAPTPSVPSQIA